MRAGMQRCGFVETMKDVLRENEAGMGPMSGLALLTACILAVAISYNALFSQPAAGGRKAMAGVKGSTLSTRISVDAEQAGSTVLLRYDPAVEEIQRGLLATGDYKGMVDGVAGKQTRLAIESYQRKQGLPVDGEVSTELADHIRYTQTVAKAAEFTGSVSEPETEVDAAQVRNVQATLAELGYQPGDVSGEMNAATEAAIRQFQVDRGLNPDGVISIALITELARQSGDPAPSAE
jgi:peptidoglycan hydrolase-like protein with peptidoglycan-binding domain